MKEIKAEICSSAFIYYRKSIYNFKRIKKKASKYIKAFLSFKKMRKMGLEPTQLESYKILSLARLPVPTLPHS